MLRKALSVRKALPMKQNIKASAGTKKVLSEFCVEVLSIESDIKFDCFVRFKRVFGIKIYKICDTLLPLPHNLLVNPLSYCIPFFGIFTSLPAICNK